MTGWASWLPYRTVDDVPRVLGPVDRNRALIEMVGTGGFEDTPALARWSETAEAQPILREFLIAAMTPPPSELHQVDLDLAKGEMADQDTLAADIEARFGR
ncbi:hypothetical protein [Sphingomonas sp. PAMC 26605]|uniref:hypothetical protein n=1 Tax=Sphingomonas sp. PAMC 26605 TaxID=1112214 RepID=UPI00026CDE29|nr:hypothetical protein [Sphingomonas sp. PAMC 26605]